MRIRIKEEPRFWMRSKYWSQKAIFIRDLADTQLPENKRLLLVIADDFDKLASLARVKEADDSKTGTF
jgi:hypothetical protein